MTDPNDSDFPVAGHGGETIPMRTLLHERNSDRELHLVASMDNMRVYMKIAPGVNFSGVTREMIVGAMAASGVRYGLIEPGVRLFVHIQNSSEPFTGFFQVARGEPMRRGENGSIEFHVQPTAMNPRYDENASGAIDYKQLNLIENCFAGQRIASILPPGPGRAGRDVFGAEIPTVPGDPAVVRAGSGVVTSANGREFNAEVEGRVVFEEGVLSVSPLLEISRDIDYSVGNVDFAGKVVVHGSLLDGFSINARRGVELLGDMGAGHITSEGDVVIAGGIKGKNAAVIACRSLSARYIDDASVEAHGDVTATKEIMHSNVKSLGRVTVTQGAIIGGEVYGFQGVEADTLGSDMGVATLVAAGLDWTEENKKTELRARIAEYMDRLRSATFLLDPLLADKGIGARLDAERKSMLADLVSELGDVRERLAELLEERARLEEREHAGQVDRINVRKMLHMGVSARFRALTSQVKDAVKGPLSLRPDERHSALSVGAFEELPKTENQ
ncbi:MAG: FapA family protein [Planctomycetota bacterium]|jgi:uncharacterized protein (DUF342 family)|nr:FapA family protein [Planctomycetota bacterium]